MKVNRTYCINEDLAKLLEPMNASATINELLLKYFEADITDNIPAMREKLLKLMQKKKEIMTQIRHFKSKIAQKQEKIDAKKAEKLNEKEKEARKIEVEAIKQKYFAGEVTEQEYMDFFK